MYFLFQISRFIIVGHALAFLSVLLDAGSLSSVQLLHSKIPDFQLSVIRYVGMTIISAFPFCFGKCEIKISTEDIPLMILMRFTGLSYNCLFFGAASLLPLAHAGGMFFASRILFVAILTKYIARTTLGALHLIAIIISIGGIVCVLQPWHSFILTGFSQSFLEPRLNQTGQNNTSALESDIFYQKISEGDLTINVTLGYILVFLAGASDAANVFIAGHSLKHMGPFVQSVITGISCSIASLILSLYIDEIVISLTISDLASLAIHTLFSTMLMWTVIASSQRITPSGYSIIGSLSIIVELLLQYTAMPSLYGWRNYTEVIGCVFIVASAILTSLSHASDVLE